LLLALPLQPMIRRQNVVMRSISCGTRGGSKAERKEELPTAVTLCTKAAEQGYAEAQLNLGLMYSNGKGVPQDYAKAAEWYAKAAIQGHYSAQFELGNLYLRGQGVAKDLREAFALHEMSAGWGYPLAQFRAGVMYAEGSGVPKNNVRALMWLSLASQSGVEKADSLIETLREGMTPKQVKKGQRLAAKWLKKFKARQDGD
jgi:TPR repeat protein